MTVVACCQLAPRVGEPERNRAAMVAAAADAAARGAQVVVLPELANSGYVFRTAAEARALAEPATPDGPTVAALAAVAAEHDAVIVAGLCELDADGSAVRNAAVLLDGAAGLRAVYRKAHLWDRERFTFVPGDQPPPVVATRAGRIAVMVCYDLEFPEWIRLPALAGADLLCAPVNWPAAPRPAGERAGEVVRAQAAASTNRMYLAVADRVGDERGVAWTGGSVIVEPDGFPVAGPASAGAVTTLIADCDLAAARDKRLNDNNDVLADRRPELYGSLAGERPDGEALA